MTGTDTRHRATLLLAHAKTQTLNQKRLENYLAAAQTPNLDISDRFSESSPRRLRSPARGAGGADTPRDLNARIKILELYTLHVLLRNNEWDYAREFIGMSPILDDERREAFLQALQSLQDEQHEAEKREREEHQKHEDQLRRDVDEVRRLRAENEERERKRLEEERARRQPSTADRSTEATSSSGKGRNAANQSSSQSRPRPSSSSPSSTAAKKAKTVAASPSLGTRAVMVLRNIRALLDQMALSFNANPFILYQTMAFIIGLLMMFSRKTVRERVLRVLASSWAKVRATAGMGVKVSYI